MSTFHESYVQAVAAMQKLIREANNKKELHDIRELMQLQQSQLRKQEQRHV
jgi:hypothetical protein